MASAGHKSVPLNVARRIDVVCRQFESAWRAAENPRLENYLEEVPPPDRPALFEELLRLEVEFRFTAGAEPAAADLYQRFPGEKSRIEAVWQDIAANFSPPPAIAADGPTNLGNDAPTSVGRYRIDRLLGAGAFGRVYLATDSELHRAVAVKISHKAELSRPDAYDAFLAEARTLARLDHPAVVPVYDVGRTDDGCIFIVTKLIEGSTLAQELARGRPTPLQAGAWMATAAEALHSAHELGLVHRDIKPSNLLIDAAQAIFVSDFGLALREEEFDTGPGLVGTPAYMSPEQARGEGHRVDARSDVFALGVVLYQLLTGRRPFRAETRQEILEQILTVEPRSPRQVDRHVPRELERVCLRALANRGADRFETALDMAEELRRYLHIATAAPASAGSVTGRPANGYSAGPAGTPTAHGVGPFPHRVVPKGLRSFDAEDADFFLGLLPGPRDAEGLSQGLQFWKRPAESRGEDAFAVGLLYGPSGCGKSSLVKAGLLPRLAGHVLGLMLEASADDTEARLLRSLRRHFPSLTTAANLPEAFAALCRGHVLPPGKKLFLVIDQFEQWLHGRADYRDTDLARALRQCDGAQVQCLLLIRDDFWLAANRFMQELEIPIREGRNSALVDLFDPRHARNVLAAFGQAYGALPENPADWTRDQEAFLDRAVAGLARENKVICVRLALFAEMVKDKAWSPAFLDRAGGLEGIGEAFLEEVFAARSAPPEHQLHQAGARAVLRALLPETGVEIKGHLRTAEQLREAAGYESRPREFASLLDLLDTRLHLITPAERAGDSTVGDTLVSPTDRCFQLTHDYLVPSLRAWLNRKQRETRRGRAELCLAERVAFWAAQPQGRHLPTVWEWLAIRTGTWPRTWTAAERSMMRRAGRRYLGRATAAVILVALVGCGILGALTYLRANNLVDHLASADTKEVPALVSQLGRYRYWANPRLAAMVADQNLSPRQRLHASLALLPSDPTQLDFLCQQLLQADPATFLVLRDALQPFRAALVPPLLTLAEDAAVPDDQRLRAGLRVGRLDARGCCGGPAAVVPPVPRAARMLVAAVVRAPNQFALLVEAARPAGAFVVPPLVQIAADRTRTEPELLMATSLLLELAGDRSDVLTDLLLAADAKRFATIFPAAVGHADRVIPILNREIESLAAPAPPGSEAQEQERDRRADRQANAAIALLRLERNAPVWPLFRHSPDPRVRSFLVDRLGAYGVDSRRVVARLEQETDASARRALLLSLGEFAPSSFSGEETRRVGSLVEALYRDDPDPGIHGAAEWLLRHWGHGDLPSAVATARPDADPPPRGWYVNGQGHTMMVVPGPADFQMSLLQTKSDKAPRLHNAHIPRTFAIGSKEVTSAQFSRFLGKAGPTASTVVHSGVTWYDAARYCNWLSQVEGIRPDQWCYVSARSDKGDEILEAAPDFATRTGYRLPTEAEWDFACRAGACTPRYYGYAPALLPKYAWYVANSDERPHPPGLLKPNDLGLFDMYGNLWEWCQDTYVNDPGGHTSRNRPAPPAMTVRGGAFTARPWFLFTGWRSDNFANGHDETQGFRIARTMPVALVSRDTDEPKSQSVADNSLHVIRSSVYTLAEWHNQTGVRTSRYAGEQGGIGFRVVRTEARDLRK